MYDDALVKLGELKQTVKAAILAGHTQLDDARQASINYGDDESEKAKVQIQSEATKIDGYVQDMVNLVLSVGQSPGPCLRLYQPQIDQILYDALSGLQSCVVGVNQQVNQVYNDGIRDIDATNSKVAEDEAQLQACSSTGSILCVSPVVRQIDAHKIELPQIINSAVHNTIPLIETTTNQVDGCTSTSISQFVTDGNIALTVLQQCLDSL